MQDESHSIKRSRIDKRANALCLMSVCAAFAVVSAAKAGPLQQETSAPTADMDVLHVGDAAPLTMVAARKAGSQIEALEAAKAARTPAQQKISSQLLLAIPASSARARALQVAPRLKSSVKADAKGRVEVDIKAIVTPALIAGIVQRGGIIESSFPQFGAIRARVPLKTLESIAALKGIKFIKPASRPITKRVRPKGAAAPSRVEPETVVPRVASQGTVVSEGDITLRARDARQTFNVDGTGIKVGVISDSVDGLSASRSAGELPAVTVLRSGSPDTGEGTAMLEIVHDIAPGAQLFFSSGSGGKAALAQAILNLRDAGCNIIVDDLGYGDEGVFQDDEISDAIHNVAGTGVLYFGACGNDGNKDDGTSSTYEGDFVAGPNFPTGKKGKINLFAGKDMNVVNGGSDNAVLTWADPLGAATDDYDFYDVDADTGEVLSASTDIQNGTQDPFEFLSVGDGEAVMVVLAKGSPRFLRVTTASDGVLDVSTGGSTFGHSATSDMFSVAAAPVAQTNGKAFTSKSKVETFSSDGFRRLFFNSDGTPITPGNFSASGGKVLRKPDFTSADGAVSSRTDFNPFFGTSAAAPHLAAVAALVKSYRPSLTGAQINTIFVRTALDIEARDFDRDAGRGIVLAYDAIASIAPARPANDDFENAQLLNGNASSVNGTNVGATRQTGEPSHDATNTNEPSTSVWYRYQPTQTGMATFSTAGSTFKNLLAAHMGYRVGLLKNLARSNAAGANSNQISFFVRAGRTYEIAVDGVKGTTGNIVLTSTFVATQPPTDDSLTPVSSSPQPDQFVTFVAKYSDPAGASNIANVTLEFGTRRDNSLSLLYRASTNTFAILDDAGRNFGQDAAPGAPIQLSNARGTLDVSQSSVARAGNTLTVTWRVSFTFATLGRTLPSMLSILNKQGVRDGREQFGSVQPVPAPPGVVAGHSTFSTASAQSDSITLRFTGALDGASASDASHYTVQINGQSVAVDAASLSTSGNVVTLHLPLALSRGDQVVVSWSGLKSPSGTQAGQYGPFKAL